MGRAVSDGMRDGVYRLLAEGIKHAPKHTAALRRSLRVLDRQSGNRVELALHSEDPAAGMQESGGTLQYRRHLMTVPIGIERAMWDATGTRREARSIPGLFRIRARDGRSYLVTRSGRRLVLRFALRRRVYQEGQGWATRATEAAAPAVEGAAFATVQHELLKTDRID